MLYLPAVFGWLSGSADPAGNMNKRVITLDEGETQELSIGFIKGTPNRYIITMDVQVQFGSASTPLVLHCSTANACVGVCAWV